MPLTDTSIKAFRPKSKPYREFDSGGLYLEIAPGGGKWWRLKYRFQGREKRISLGIYPAIGLKDARSRRDEAKELLAKGIDPGEQKKADKAATQAATLDAVQTFEAVAREWYAKKTVALTDGYRKQLMARLENLLFPYIGGTRFSVLEPADILKAIRHTEERGHIETAHRLAQITGQICRYARLVGYAKYDIASRLTEALPPVQTKHFAAITNPAEIGHLLRAIDEYQGDISIGYALRIMPYVFVRSGELRAAEWPEINLEAAEWTIPAGRMKMRRPHLVPLAPQVVKLFTELHAVTGNGRYLFPSPFSGGRCISDVGLLNALRRMGYNKGKMTVHGFRTMASTLLNEQRYRPDVIEAQLSHGDKNLIRAAYNRAEYLPERRQMMEEWAKFLDKLRAQTTSPARPSRPQTYWKRWGHPITMFSTKNVRERPSRQGSNKLYFFAA
jgi:integrase